MRLQRETRSGTTLVESAVVYPFVILMIFGLMIGGLGVFRYQEMSSLARRAARYAIVHGQQWAQDTGNTAATPTDIYNNAISPYLVILNPANLNYSVSYNSDNRAGSSIIVNGDVKLQGNTVSVTVSYNWVPEALLGTGVTLSSTSVMAMSY
jgi:Flp pilus assembly protein TadG